MVKSIYLTYLALTLAHCRTSPPFNILLYNALGGRGDELYGIEPASYYLKNLLLNLGPVFPLACLLPTIVIFRWFAFAAASIRKSSLKLSQGQRKTRVSDEASCILVLCACVFLWLLTLLSRPHKVRTVSYSLRVCWLLM